ncbi:hypothetical protein Tco_0281421 [Tanacetum coccineum]
MATLNIVMSTQRASKEGPPAILATIDRTPYTITESLVRSQLQLDDEGGVKDLSIADIYLGSWDQFGSQLAIAIICLTEGRRYNWSSYIFKGMVNNINNPKKFLLFPRPTCTFGYLCFLPLHKLLLQVKSSRKMPISPSRPVLQESPQPSLNPKKVIISHDHVSTPPRPTATTSGAPVTEQGPSSDPNIASSSRPHESALDLFTSTNVEDESIGGSFQTSPPSPPQAPPT